MRIPFIALLVVVVMSGCSTQQEYEGPRRMGGKVDLADFKAKTSTYQGKSIHLILKVAAGQNLQSLAGKDVNFIATGQRGEQVKLVIAIPASTVVPELGETDTLSVLFKCTRGSLLKGNETVTVELP